MAYSDDDHDEQLSGLHTKMIQREMILFSYRSEENIFFPPVLTDRYLLKSESQQLFSGSQHSLFHVEVWLDLILPLISSTSKVFLRLLISVSIAPVTNGVNGIFLFHSLFISLARSYCHVMAHGDEEVGMILSPR